MIDRSGDQSDAGEARLRAYLTEHGVVARIVSPGVPMPTVPLAAAAIGVHESQIIKSVLFQSIPAKSSWRSPAELPASTAASSLPFPVT